MTVTIPSEWEQFIAERVAAGRSADEVLVAALQALHLKEQHEAKRAELVALLDEAEAEVAAGKVIRNPPSARQMLEEIRQRRGES